MSASLVGSEMCIRDSRLRPSGPGGGRSGACGRVAGRTTQIGPGSSCSSCLLYTSDAADDM
eukprot:5733434-Alexandrium_andersonii.AAC.1